MSIELYFKIVFGVGMCALGCALGSFLNVCIWRIPRGESIAWPPSHCPKCNARIRWYQNLPIVSYVVLRGRCANCHEAISPRYILVEAITGLLFLGTYLRWANPACGGFTPIQDPFVMAASGLVIMGLILGSAVDLAEFWIPDRVTIGGMLLGVPISFLVPEMQGQGDRLMALYHALGGMAFGFLFLWGVGAVFSKLFKKDAMGFGDVKLMGAIGAFFGPVAVLFVIVVSSVVGSLVGALMLLRGKAKLGGFTMVPYGPFLALATLIWMFWGWRMILWYCVLCGVVVK